MSYDEDVAAMEAEKNFQEAEGYDRQRDDQMFIDDDARVKELMCSIHELRVVLHVLIKTYDKAVKNTNEEQIITDAFNDYEGSIEPLSFATPDRAFKAGYFFGKGTA